MAPAPTADRVASRAGYGLVYVQMLTATLPIPAIRPLFAREHGGHVGAMHAFMSVNMVGAILAASLVTGRGRGAQLVRALALVDAVLLALLPLRWPIPVVLTLRFLEGAAHVGAATLLVAAIAANAPAGRTGRAMGAAGMAIMLAVATGSGLGGLLVPVDPRLPFFAGAALALLVAILAPAAKTMSWAASQPGPRLPLALLRRRPALWAPLAAAGASRFAVGCIVVSFAIFAHRTHGFSDRAVGGLTSLLVFTFAFATYPFGRWSDRMPRACIMGAGGIVSALALVGMAGLPSAALPAVLIVAGLGWAAMFSAVLGYASCLVEPSERRASMSLLQAAGALGMVLGPAVAGIGSGLASRIAGPAAGARVAFWIAAAALAVWFAAAAPWLVRRARAETKALAPPVAGHLAFAAPSQASVASADRGSH